MSQSRNFGELYFPRHRSAPKHMSDLQSAGHSVASSAYSGGSGRIRLCVPQPGHEASKAGA